MLKIVLPRGEWFYDPMKPLGNPGGFGAVYEGVSDANVELAVKRLHLTANDAAHREMKIATDLSGRTLNNVIAVWDAGEDANTGAYFVVMPKAERSLQSDLSKGISFSDTDAARVLLDIVSGLIEVNDIVHRDLKPANILFHQGVWKVADFGIARFVEDSTSLHTLKDCLSAPYAAPEQWQFIHATAATDVYALGCIGYTLLTGSPPFMGPTTAEFREQHLHGDPPTLPARSAPRLKTLLSMMLRKAPSARPNLGRVETILREMIQSTSSASSGGFGLLAQAGADVAREQAQVEQKRQQELWETEVRNQLANTGRKILADIIERLLTRITREVPIAQKSSSGITLGRGRLEVSLSGADGSRLNVPAAPLNWFPNSKWDVIAVEEIVVNQDQPRYQWSSSLWYCQLPNTTGYRWYEASYFAALRSEEFAPYSLVRNPSDADLAASHVMHIYQLAFGPSAVDDENEEEFIDRWAALLALASQGKLVHPRILPLQPSFWLQPAVG